ncbi:replicative dna helicase : Probable replicative DNA helicase OS=Rhodopirellula baltica (strain SH1) GN=dnaB PE=4 SV=1: DnaB_C [Gemmata massiliana]|uniref:SF4 helicase domain-containing protein n=1 Tax=Gemmata massiliana TaxID=1210884 RepID=A0A6P2CV15_9BACT|nr:DnaB-like helicase C-terminal domain-containing protein [Gemmata massiliana]VTR92753.1 replicative dna helicase : Probable replicative DNA helicase OS=Rhodopirellula baltica (strain SH1) GN=dnaB PE=4 SV=1: DnaB_C [Gemmata massiliana]
MNPAFVPAADVFAAWKGDLLSGKPPTLYPVAEPGNPLTRIEIGPGIVTMFGGSPGAGKTALVMQLVVDALRLTPALKVLVANVEMPPAALMDRQMSRLSGIDLHAIRHRTLKPEHGERVTVGMNTLAEFVPRLAFARPPYSLDNIARSADAFGADVLVLDYIQRIAPPGDHAHRKAAIDAAMEYVRGFADAGVAVLVVAAVGRQRDENGRSGYSGLNLASFRESSELEYGTDDAFLLVRDNVDDSGSVTLKHAKSRYGEPVDIPLRFDGRVQRFDPAERDDGKLAGAVRDVWGRRPADPEGGEW